MAWISNSNKKYEKRDSYEIFLEQFGGKEAFFRFGLDETIYIDPKDVREGWENLKKSIESKSTVFMRGFGRDGASTHMFIDFYNEILGLGEGVVQKDVNGNDQPTKLLQKYTGFTKNKDIFNFQVSHIFGKTKNIYAFTAPWNIVFMPKILDPFTGHEAKGEMVGEFQKLFQHQSYLHFKDYIEEFNEIVIHLNDNIQKYFDDLRESPRFSEAQIKKFSKAIDEEFAPISINLVSKP